MTDTTQLGVAWEDPTESPWAPELDALIAAPDHHKLLFENDRVRVLDTTIAPGDRTPVHTHRWPAASYILSWSHSVRYDGQGKLLLDSRQVPAFASPPPVVWSAPLAPHALENVGNADFHLISVEVKDTQGIG